MKKFEYKSVVLDCNPQAGGYVYGNFSEKEFASTLKMNGDDGWELVSIVPAPLAQNTLLGKILKPWYGARLVFKREIE